MSDRDVCDRPLNVLVHEDGVVLVAQDGTSFAVSLRAAEESAVRLLEAVRGERAALAGGRAA